MGQKFKDAQYEKAIPNSDLLDCAQQFQQLQSQFCDTPDGSCPPPGDCPDLGDIEDGLDDLVTNLWETGQIWGDIFANMQQATIEV